MHSTDKIKAHALKTRQKITQLEKVHFIKMNELKLTQVILVFSLYVCHC